MLLSRAGMVGGGVSNSSVHTRGCPSTALPLSLQQGQPVPATSLERETPWGGGSSGRGLLAAPPPCSCLLLGDVRGRCVQEMKAAQCPGVKLFSRRWAASFQVLVQARGCGTLPETSSPVLRALWKLCFVFTVWLRHLEASNLQTTALGHQASSWFPETFKSGVVVMGSF